MLSPFVHSTPLETIFINITANPMYTSINRNSFHFKKRGTLFVHLESITFVFVSSIISLDFKSNLLSTFPIFKFASIFKQNIFAQIFASYKCVRTQARGFCLDITCLKPVLFQTFQNIEIWEIEKLFVLYNQNFLFNFSL